MHTPSRRNDLLSSLPSADLKRLLDPLEWVELPSGATLHEAGARLTQVYFPVTAVVSLNLDLKDGAAAELALVGSEGVVGIGAFMGEGLNMGRATVQSAGACWRVPAVVLDEAARADPRLMQALLRYAQALFQQVAQLAACGRHHELQARLCRWLLSHMDRSPGHALRATHDQIAHGLGVRREGVSVVAQKLLKAGLIQYSRGNIRLLDRAGLEALSCECYAEVRDCLADAKQATVFPEMPEPPAHAACAALFCASHSSAPHPAWA